MYHVGAAGGLAATGLVSGSWLVCGAFAVIAAGVALLRVVPRRKRG